MQINDLINMDMGEVVDWLMENQGRYVLVEANRIDHTDCPSCGGIGNDPDCYYCDGTGVIDRILPEPQGSTQ